MLQVRKLKEKFKKKNVKKKKLFMQYQDKLKNTIIIIYIFSFNKRKMLSGGLIKKEEKEVNKV